MTSKIFVTMLGVQYRFSVSLFMQKLIRSLKTLLIGFTCTSLIGCATSPFPQFLTDGTENGGIFLAGDNDCIQYNFHNNYTINCYDTNHNFTGQRFRMTEEEIQDWETKKKIKEFVEGAVIVVGAAALIFAAALGASGGGGYTSNQGCCSWHGGIAGCQYGRVLCNDGEYSPTCTCP